MAESVSSSSSSTTPKSSVSLSSSSCTTATATATASAVDEAHLADRLAATSLGPTADPDPNSDSGSDSDPNPDPSPDHAHEPEPLFVPVLAERDPYLRPFLRALQWRLWRFRARLREVSECEAGVVDTATAFGGPSSAEDPFRVDESRLAAFVHRLFASSATEEVWDRALYALASGYEKFGIRVDERNNIVYREWAPSAVRLSLVGDFNNWNNEEHPGVVDDFGIWTVNIPADPITGGPRIGHNCSVKVAMQPSSSPDCDWIYRIPAWIRHAAQRPHTSPTYTGVFWNPPTLIATGGAYPWRHPRPQKNLNPNKSNSSNSSSQSLRIYEVHIGMSSEHGEIASYCSFVNEVLPHVHRMGYTALQIMAVQEHPYYASFGYQVTSFFAASSRFGTPEDLKYLIDEAHARGIVVLLDVVHSHASSNVEDGLNQFDGSDHQYFHAGGKGFHDQWKTRLFDYGKYETLRFLLSNLCYWVEEFRFDGFRFDGVTSMLYLHHGNFKVFTTYQDYFGAEIDEDCVLYLQLANYMLHKKYPDFMITIAEDVSGMPGLCRPVEEGGIGFDYRLGMAVPDMWIKLLKECPDETWEMGSLVHSLTNRRIMGEDYVEKTVAYAESHDQALVGDKTLMMWLLNEEIYTHMSVFSPLTPRVDRGIALHKMIRLITFSLGGEAFMTFMGNEFGHPEWIDFPREGNHQSYAYCRRQWHLMREDHLRYKYLLAFEKAMQQLESRYNFLNSMKTFVSLKHESDKLIVFERNHLIFIFNFHATNSYPDYRIGCPLLEKYNLVLDSDSAVFMGHQRLADYCEYFPVRDSWNDRPYSMQVYIPSRSVIVLAPATEAEQATY